MPFSPSSIFDIAVYEAGDIAGNDGDPVSAWNHQSGTISGDMSQTGTARPTLQKGVNGLNNKNVVLFDGSNDVLNFGDLAELDFGTGAFAIFLVLKVTAGDKYIFVKDLGSGADNGIYFYANASNVFN